MRRSTVGGLPRDLDDVAARMRMASGFDDVMRALSPPERSPLLSGKLMMVCTCAQKVLAPGEVSKVPSLPMEQPFQLDYLVVDSETTFDPKTGNAVLFFHHDQLMPNFWSLDCGKKIPASLFLCRGSARVQQADVFERRVYQAGEVVVVGKFENAGDAPLLVRVGIVGKCVDRRDEVTSTERAGKDAKS